MFSARWLLTTVQGKASVAVVHAGAFKVPSSHQMQHMPAHIAASSQVQLALQGVCAAVNTLPITFFEHSMKQDVRLHSHLPSDVNKHVSMPPNSNASASEPHSANRTVRLRLLRREEGRLRTLGGLSGLALERFVHEGAHVWASVVD